MLFHNNHTDTANECFSGPFKGEVLDASLIQVIIIFFYYCYLVPLTLTDGSTVDLVVLPSLNLYNPIVVACLT